VADEKDNQSSPPQQETHSVDKGYDNAESPSSWHSYGNDYE
jgi:hypothetical protein